MWVLTAALARLRSDFNAAFPNRDHASDGTIGDAAHQAETSGHNPDDTPGSRSEYTDADSIPEVRAFDCDSDLRTAGVTAQDVVDRMLLTPADLARLRYIIYNRRIWSRNTNWQPRAYTGASAHVEHIHFSGDPDQDGNAAPWTSVTSFAQEADMALDGIQAVQLSNSEAMLGAIRDLSDAVTLNPGDNKPRPFPSALAAMVKGMRADLAALKAANAAGGVDPAAVAALVVEQLGPLLPTLSDIEGIVDAKVKAALNATRFNVVTGG